MSLWTRDQIGTLTSGSPADPEAKIRQSAHWYIQGIYGDDACLCTIRFDDKLPRSKMPVIGTVQAATGKALSSLMSSKPDKFHSVIAPWHDQSLDPTFVRFLRGSVQRADEIVACFLPTAADMDPSVRTEERVEVPEDHHIETLYDELVDHLTHHFDQHFLLGRGHHDPQARVSLQATRSGYDLTDDSKVNFLGRWQKRVGSASESEGGCSSGIGDASHGGDTTVDPDRPRTSAKTKVPSKTSKIIVDVFGFGEKLRVHRMRRSDEKGESYSWYAMAGKGVNLGLDTVAKSERPIRPPLSPDPSDVEDD